MRMSAQDIGTGDPGVSSWSEAYVRVYAASKEDCQAVTAAITARLREDFLGKAHIELRRTGTLRQDARRQIVQAAAKEGVWVKFPEDRRKKHEIPKLTLQGESKAVLKAQNAIQKLLEQEKSSLGAGPSADYIPRRGTPEFLRYMGGKTNHEPPRYWKCYKPGFSLTALIMELKDVPQNYHKETLGNEEYKEVEAVVMKTWRRDLVGHGKDAQGLHHKSIAIKKIRRLENRELYKTYAEYRARLFAKAARLGKPFARVERLPQCSGPVKTTAITHQSLKRDIYPEVNEHYLLYGTKADTVHGICVYGIQSRLASVANMFGAGAYLCESSTKADQYADPKNQRSGGEKTMVLLRALLGEPFVTATPHPYKIPPCRHQCGEKKCAHDHFDSIIADGMWNFRDFVLYHEAQMYPEYIITYERM